MAKMDEKIIKTLKHFENFYEQAPPGTVKDEEERPEDCIPDTEENRAARDFLANAPSKGLWMPLGKEVKVMQCWRCKQYGHRTGDRECPLFLSGNSEIEKFRAAHEDPMYHILQETRDEAKEKKVQWLKTLLDKSSSSSDSDTSSKKHKRKKKKSKKKKEKDEWVEAPSSKKNKRQYSDDSDSRDNKHSKERKLKKHKKEKSKKHESSKHNKSHKHKH